MREHEDVQERTTLRYEERITELHSIIAELNKKIDRLQGTTIRYCISREVWAKLSSGVYGGVHWV